MSTHIQMFKLMPFVVNKCGCLVQKAYTCFHLGDAQVVLITLTMALCMPTQQWVGMHNNRRLKLKQLNGIQPLLILLLTPCFADPDMWKCTLYIARILITDWVTLILRWKTKLNRQCSVDSWVGGPTPSVPPSAGSLQERLRLHSTPFCTIDHPQTADPVLAFWKNGLRHTFSN